LAAIENAVANGRGGEGTVFLWAAGNGDGSGDDSNYDGWANLPANHRGLRGERQRPARW